MAQHTRPDFHFLLIASSLGAEWLFDAARLYWERFHPVVVNDVELIRLIPVRFSVIVTVVARRDLSTFLLTQLEAISPNILIDPIIYDYFEDARLTLNGRAEVNHPFGVPVTPTVTPLPSPTPWPTAAPPTEIPTRAPGGFITRTPLPDATDASGGG